MGCGNSMKRIGDEFHDIKEIQVALKKAGLESSNLIFGIDYTKSNLYTGDRTFNAKCLHDLTVKNPYMEVIEILGQTLEIFDDDHIIPCYGFGDSFTTDKSVFPFYEDKEPVGFKDVLDRYKAITPGISLAGPTNFAPLIRKAIEIVEHKKSYHILVICTDGYVSDEKDTTKAIVDAAKWPISIICVGVGDGPWDGMEKFDDKIGRRKFDNFQFVDFMKIRKKYCESFPPNFALHALMEIPRQFEIIKKLGYLNK